MSYAANLEESCSPSLNYKSSYLFPEYNDETVIKTIILFQSEILEEKKRGGELMDCKLVQNQQGKFHQVLR